MKSNQAGIYFIEGLIAYAHVMRSDMRHKEGR